jgi:ribosomal protein S8
MRSKFKNIIFKIKIAKKKKKICILIKVTVLNTLILNTLWNNKLIYGYYIITSPKNKRINYYQIILKYSNSNLSLFNKVFSLYYNIKCYNILSINLLENNYMYLIINDKGYFNIKCALQIKTGGTIFLKL